MDEQLRIRITVIDWVKGPYAQELDHTLERNSVNIGMPERVNDERPLKGENVRFDEWHEAKQLDCSKCP